MTTHPPIVTNALDELSTFCREWGITELALFGSVLRDDFHADSDIDLLVRFRDDIAYTLFDLVRMGDQLEAIFGRDVDIIDRKALEQSANPIRRNTILDSAEVIYAER
ncbi:MAG: nucleotidyltransferase [Candidatus Viridilinea halotolerans]|uniref:Nucleotidyltransferase n=1 Tax=Candidatus Viridilinea halotolerans TaxID=2491704 RepID=A0A426TY55_9CHLR|nr:MAG: nucleotidyltransferase [Candidatus Viridilinea halotolerans]